MSSVLLICLSSDWRDERRLRLSFFSDDGRLKDRERTKICSRSWSPSSSIGLVAQLVRARA